MYAQLVRSRTTHQKGTEIHRVVIDEVIPALHNEPGFAGALSLVNPVGGDAIMILLWHSDEQVQTPSGDNGTNLLAPLLRIACISGGDQETTSVWEVTVRV